jgi:hypothetical protein
MYPTATVQRDKSVDLAMDLPGKLFDGRATNKVSVWLWEVIGRPKTVDKSCIMWLWASD